MSKHIKTVLYKAVLLSMALGLMGTTIALAFSGELDSTFDFDGRVITDIDGQSDVLHALAIQSDGKIVAVGDYNKNANSLDFALTRYNTNGSLDTTFGKHLLDFGFSDIAYDVALQANGKIVLAGTVCFQLKNCDLGLARYNSNGSLDTSFSADGKLVTKFGKRENGTYGGLAIQPDGKIVVAGFMHNGNDIDYAVYRFLSNGHLDTTFSGDGKFNFGFVDGQDDIARALAIQSDGKILVAGSANTGGLDYNFAIVRLNKNGTLDTTFSGDGRLMIDFGGKELAYGLALQPDGKIVIVGSTTNLTSSNVSIAMARFKPNGNLDNTFGQLLPTGKRSGKKVFTIPAGTTHRNSEGRDVIVDPDGKLVIAGFRTWLDGKNEMVLVRLKPNGGFDPTFNGGGRVFFAFSRPSLGFTVVRQPSDGKYVIGGLAIDPVHPANSNDFALARVLP